MSDSTGIDTQGRGIVRWAQATFEPTPGEKYISLTTFWDYNEGSPDVSILLTPDEARQVIAGLERMIAAVEKSS